jgi:hypothetical protein
MMGGKTPEKMLSCEQTSGWYTGKLLHLVGDLFEMCLFFSSYCQKAVHMVSLYCTCTAVMYSCAVIKDAWLGPCSHGFLTSSLQHELCDQLFHSYCIFCSSDLNVGSGYCLSLCSTL